MNKQNIKAILFDLDGTLFKSEWYHFMAWNKAVKNFDISIKPETAKIYVGKSAKWIEDDIRVRYNANFKEGELIKEKEKIFTELFGEVKQGDDLMPHAKDILQYFFDNSFKLAVCTCGGREETIQKLKNSDIEKYFNEIFTADDVEFCKPAPDVYQLAVNVFKLSPDECLAIEDTESGLVAAKEAGVFCFVIPTEHSKGQSFERADKIFNSLKDVFDFFN
ncbi:MAG: HAD family phosphatase [Candidatus Paceibacterota bacterium]